MSPNKYVICAKYKNEDEIVYAQLDDGGPMATGYPCWSSLYGAKKFETKEEALIWFNQNKKWLFNSKKVDCQNVWIGKIKIEVVEKIDVALDYETYLEEQKEIEEYKRLREKYGNSV